MDIGRIRLKTVVDVESIAGASEPPAAGGIPSPRLPKAYMAGVA